MTSVVQRTTRRFSWTAVDPKLTRRLLVAVYEADGRDDDVSRLRGLKDERLVRQAEASLGRPLAARHMDSIVDVLRDAWLPTLSSGDLDLMIWDLQISLRGPARTAQPTTKPARVAFLRERRSTDTLKAQLRAAFIRAHKIEQTKLTDVRGTSAERQQHVVELVGVARVDRRTPYPHQVQTWAALDDLYGRRRARRRSGLVVLPTGAGKTYTLVRWLLDRLAEAPELRVLWVADQQELLDQAARTFYAESETLRPDFFRKLRVIHGGASPASVLADPEVDVACVTRQSLVGRNLDAPAKDRLEQFLTRPCVVVVDEAHHAVSRTYRKLLGHIQDEAPTAMLVGLTATPWPSGAGMTKLLRERFSQSLAEVNVRDLVASGVLARPVMHSVDTGHLVQIQEGELRAMAGGDVPASVLRRLDRSQRNEIIVDAWIDRRNEWGKTLVFACDIEHADNLGQRFREAGVEASVVHSQAEVERSDAIDAFRRAKGPQVLVSVGMLLEGVDVPDARTAFLTRPTTSRVLMRQMIGRVLRGVAGGGEEIAHVVDLRDRWDVDADVLAPVDIPMSEVAVIEVGWHDDEPQRHVLPPVRDELTNLPIGEDVLRRIQRAYDELLSVTIPHPRALLSTTLVGFYELGDTNVPVFEHAAETWDELVDAELRQTATSVRSPIELFDSLPVPRPVKSDVAAVLTFVRSQQVEPPFVAVRSTISVRGVASDLLTVGAMSEPEKFQWLLDRYERSLARSAYHSFQAFYEAVTQEIMAMVGPNPRSRPEGFLSGAASSRPPLGRRADREIAPLLKDAAAQGRTLLRNAGEPGYHAMLAPAMLPRVDWTRRPVKSTFAYWAPRIGGQRKGEPIIRVSRVLQASRSRVSDELLKFLLWHELCHHLLPGRGHDAEFHRLLLLWPSASRLDSELDTLRERWDLGDAGTATLPAHSGSLSGMSSMATASRSAD